MNRKSKIIIGILAVCFIASMALNIFLFEDNKEENIIKNIVTLSKVDSISYNKNSITIWSIDNNSPIDDIVKHEIDSISINKNTIIIWPESVNLSKCLTEK